MRKSPSGEQPPLYRQPGVLLLVGVGGGAGTLARAGIDELAEQAWSTAIVNVLGAFALGLMLQALAGAGPRSGRAHLARLVAGAGFLGAFTTYSTFAVQVATTLPGPVALAYAGGLLTLGMTAACLGALTGASVARHRPSGGRTG